MQKSHKHHYVPNWYQRRFMLEEQTAYYRLDLSPEQIKTPTGKIIKKAEVQEIPVYKEVVTPLPGVRTHLGLIAQEVEECLGGRDLAIVTKDENGYGLRYEELIAPLIKAVQELSAEVAELKLHLQVQRVDNK